MKGLVGYDADSDSDDGAAPSAPPPAPPRQPDGTATPASSGSGARALNPAAAVPAHTPRLGFTPAAAGSASSSPRPGSSASLGVKRASSPAAAAGAASQRAAAGGSSNGPSAGPSSLRQLVSPRRAQDSPLREQRDSPAATAHAGEELLGLLAPPPLVREDGSLDSEWGLPQPQAGEVDPALEAKLLKFHELKAAGTHFNVSLARNRQLRNPHIYAKLVKWVDVDEGASCYPERAPEAWSATPAHRRALMREGGKDVLADMQRAQQAQREAAQAPGKARAIDFAPPAAGSAQPADAAALALSRANAVRDRLMAKVSAREPERGGERERERERDRERDRARDWARDRDRYRERDGDRGRDGDADRRRDGRWEGSARR